MPRPIRLRLPDFAGRQFTLPDGPESWQELGRSGAPCCLVLGLGPFGAGPTAKIRPGDQVYWLECEGTLAVIKGRPPAHWLRVSQAEARELAPHCRIYFYTPGLRLAPRFWHRARAEVEWALQREKFRPGAKMVWLPGDSTMLLHQELKKALMDCAYNVSTALPHESLPLREVWGRELPRFVLSVNLRGLDAAGEIFGLCRAADIPVAIWFVDNVWNQLSAIPLPWWQEAQLFVSDKSFIPALKDIGAENVRFLPLAASGHFFEARGTGSGKPIFVGRSSFPGRDSYFAHCHIEPELLKTALAMLERNERPDFSWWEEQYQARLWPGNGARLPAYGAELCSERRRSLWLKAAVPHGLEIVGDANWKKLLPGAPVAPPVDYYGPLPKLYADAFCCLNVSTLLMPGNLNQRLFDVWAAGGFLLTDYTAGLEIFPEELLRGSVLEQKDDFAARVEWLHRHEAQRRKLIGEWQQLLLDRHLYQHRIATLVEVLFPGVAQTL